MAIFFVKMYYISVFNKGFYLPVMVILVIINGRGPGNCPPLCRINSKYPTYLDWDGVST